MTTIPHSPSRPTGPGAAAPIRPLLTSTTAALASRDFAILATLVNGNELALLCLADPVYASLYTILYCLKHEHRFFYEGDGEHAFIGISFEFLG